MSKYTDGKEVVVAVLFEDNRLSAYHAFNLINDVPLDSLVAPVRAIEYIINNGRVTLRNGQLADHGDYIVKHPNNECRVCSFAEFKQQYTLIPEENDMCKELKPVNVSKINALIDNATKEYSHHNKKLTKVVVTLESGFMLTGESFCADPNVFDEAKGEEYSLDVVRDKLWELENYRHAHEVLKHEVQSYQGGM